MKNKIKRIIVKLNLVNLLALPLYFFRIFPIKNNRIIFENFTGKGYGDNPKYIANKLLEDQDMYELYWVIKKNIKSTFPEGINVVKLYSLKFFYILATSKVWISNSRFDQYVVKRKNQLYIQTWHGGIGNKKIEYDAEDKLSDYYKKVMKKDNKNIDIMISNGKFCTELYRRAFRYNGKIVEIGTPRNDNLIYNRELLSKKARDYFSIDSESKIVLYAPTFRNDYSNNPYDIDFGILKSELEKRTKNKWKIIVKLHPRINNSKEIINIDNEVIDATDYSDIQELICACDILITDYSSCMFEAMIANKSVIIYANDIENYKAERGFHFTFNELPFPFSTNNKELMNIISQVDFNDMKKKYMQFSERVGLIENGDASEKVCQLIKEKINGEKNGQK